MDVSFVFKNKWGDFLFLTSRWQQTLTFKPTSLPLKLS